MFSEVLFPDFCKSTALLAFISPRFSAMTQLLQHQKTQAGNNCALSYSCLGNSKPAPMVEIAWQGSHLMASSFLAKMVHLPMELSLSDLAAYLGCSLGKSPSSLRWMAYHETDVSSC